MHEISIIVSIPQTKTYTSTRVHQLEISSSRLHNIGAINQIKHPRGYLGWCGTHMWTTVHGPDWWNRF